MLPLPPLTLNATPVAPVRLPVPRLIAPVPETALRATLLAPLLEPVVSNVIPTPPPGFGTVTLLRLRAWPPVPSALIVLLLPWTDTVPPPDATNPTPVVESMPRPP